jgi:hypothetical protein
MRFLRSLSILAAAALAVAVKVPSPPDPPPPPTPHSAARQAELCEIRADAYRTGRERSPFCDDLPVESPFLDNQLPTAESPVAENDKEAPLTVRSLSIPATLWLLY